MNHGAHGSQTLLVAAIRKRRWELVWHLIATPSVDLNKQVRDLQAVHYVLIVLTWSWKFQEGEQVSHPPE